MSALRRFVAELSDEECRLIYEDHKQLELTGQVGDGALRSMTERFAWESNTDISFVMVLWMNCLATEVWRRYAVAHLEV